MRTSNRPLTLLRGLIVCAYTNKKWCIQENIMLVPQRSYQAVSLALSGLMEREIARRLHTTQPTVSRRIRQACREAPSLNLILAAVREYHRERRQAGRVPPLAASAGVSL